MQRTILDNQQQLQQSQVQQIVTVSASAAQQQLQQRISGGGFPSPTTVVSSTNFTSLSHNEHFNKNNFVIDNNRFSIMAAFFSGSRGALTNGLEQSRRQLSMNISSLPML